MYMNMYIEYIETFHETRFIKTFVHVYLVSKSIQKWIFQCWAMEVLSRCMQRLKGEQYIQPHQAQILPKKNKEYLILNLKRKYFETAINTYCSSNC